MDELEKHISSIRDELDIHEPGPGLWRRIESSITRSQRSSAEGDMTGRQRSRAEGGFSGRRRSLYSQLWRAAVAVIVAGAAMAVIAGMLRTSERLNDPQVAEVRETYRYYDDKIRTLYDEAQPLLTSNPEISSELTSGMNELDSLSAQIISDLNDNIASSEVIEALIGNYRLRIELLEEMLMLMKEHDNETEQTNGNEL